MGDPTIPELVAWCRREAENLVLLEARYLMVSPESGSTSYNRDANRLRAIASALERAEQLEAAGRAIDEHARPVNWDDADDPQQAAAWRVLDAALGKTDESIADMVRALQAIPGSRWHEAADPVADLLAERRDAALTPTPGGDDD